MEPDTQYNSCRPSIGRVITGILTILFGIADLVIAIVIKKAIDEVEEPIPLFYGTQFLIRGIAFILLSITAGCFGIYSGIHSQRKCQIVTYMVLSIVLAIFTAFGVHDSVGAATLYDQYIQLFQQEPVSGYNLFDDLVEQLHAIHAFLIINIIVNSLHCIVAIAGAAFTSSICCVPDQRASVPPMSVVVQPSPLQPQQPMGVAGAGKPPAYTTYPDRHGGPTGGRYQ